MTRLSRALLPILAIGAAHAHAASTLERVRAARTLVCGTNTEEADYSRSDDHGPRQAFDRDLCRAVAVAILGADARIVLKPFPDDTTGMDALRASAVDLLPTLTKDFTHTTVPGIGFSSVVLWDGVGFLVPAAAGVARPEDLAGKKICLLDGTEVEETVAAWLRRKNLAEDLYPFQEEGEMEAALVTSGCAAIAGDRTRLAATRLGFGPLAARFRLLEETISKDPLGAAYKRDDDDKDGRFGEIVDWVVQVLIAAEEMGVTAADAKTPAGLERRAEWDISIRRLAGKTHELGARLGLADDSALRVVRDVGNYGELYERDLGRDSAMKLARGWNRLPGNGGLMVGLPFK